MINREFISFSAVQMYDLSYSHLHKFWNNIWINFIFTGAFCRRPVDIAFAIDASGSVGSWGYYQEKIFVRNTIARFGISRSGTHAAVIVYSTSANVAISLTQYTSYSRFYYAVQRIPYTRGTTRIDLALKVAAEQVFSEDGGVRSNVPKILVLMTDGVQTRTRDSLPLDKAVLPLKSQGVQVYALAIGHFTKTNELRLIVDKSSYIFRSSKFSELSGVIGRLAVTTCRNGECVLHWKLNLSFSLVFWCVR